MAVKPNNVQCDIRSDAFSRRFEPKRPCAAHGLGSGPETAPIMNCCSHAAQRVQNHRQLPRNAWIAIGHASHSPLLRSGTHAVASTRMLSAHARIQYRDASLHDRRSSSNAQRQALASCQLWKPHFGISQE